MVNMSYCRFENTLAALKECCDSLLDTDLSKSERRARNDLIELCRDIVSTVEEDDSGEISPEVMYPMNIDEVYREFPIDEDSVRF